MLCPRRVTGVLRRRRRSRGPGCALSHCSRKGCRTRRRARPCRPRHRASAVGRGTRTAGRSVRKTKNLHRRVIDRCQQEIASRMPPAPPATSSISLPNDTKTSETSSWFTRRRYLQKDRFLGRCPSSPWVGAHLSKPLDQLVCRFSRRCLPFLVDNRPLAIR